MFLNPIRALGCFTDADQEIKIPVAPGDRQVKKMLEEALVQANAAFARKVPALRDKAEKAGVDFDEEAARTAFMPKVDGENYLMPLKFVQDFMVKKMAALQNSTSIRNTKEVNELLDIFTEFGVTTTKSVTLVFESLSWMLPKGSKLPKIAVIGKALDNQDNGIVVRFEATSELAFKLCHALMALQVIPGQIIKIDIEAVAVPTSEVFVNHNLLLTVGGKTHKGFAPAEGGKKGRVVQHPTAELMETLFHQVEFAMQEAEKAAQAAKADQPLDDIDL